MAPDSGLPTRQRRRTRKDLLEAAARLLRQGRTPSMEEVAEEALVSRATAYRYFPNVEALLVEASIDTLVPDAQAVFSADAPADPVERADRAEAALHEMTFRNEDKLRMMLVQTIQQALREDARAVPIRQNRRMALIEAALAPARRRLGEAAHRRLCAALAMIFGPESMVVFRDVLQAGAEEARQVKSWAVRALVRAALEEAGPEVPAAPHRGTRRAAR